VRKNPSCEEILREVNIFMKISLVETNGNKEYSENSTLKFCNESTPIAIGKRMKGKIKKIALFFGGILISFQQANFHSMKVCG
jgi:hypothetical protein